MFPFVTCGFTGRIRPGYFVCQHVLDGAAIAELEIADKDKIGFVCCEACSAGDPECATYSLCCADCAELNFTRKVGQA